jgi:uncharacterized protein YegP (UPF0339 family)
MPKRVYPSFLIFVDDKGAYRWSFNETVTRKVAVSAESFARIQDCEADIELVRRSRAAQLWATDEAKAGRR